jgi:glycine C-acetyltransferase
MYSKNLKNFISNELENLKGNGKFKVEREIAGRQGPKVTIDGKEYLMFASNNYLGLANHPEVLKAAESYLKDYGFGLSSVRFLSGTQTIHRKLETMLAEFLGVEDAILYSTNFMANLGFFATITNESFGAESWKDVIYSDELNHASIIDAFKLCKKDNTDKRIFPHKDLTALRTMLSEDRVNPPAGGGYRNKIIVTDGVFSMEGDTADLVELVKIAEEYEALLFVDDAHGVGVLGKTGAGTPEFCGVHGKADILSGTFGKALGGAVGGYIAGPRDIVELLRQKSRTYLFSNSVPPSVVGASIRALEILKEDPTIIEKVKENADYFRNELKARGLNVLEGSHPIVPLMIGDAVRAKELSGKLYEEGIYAIALAFPVVPEGAARIRFQVSASHTKEMLDEAIEKIEKLCK